MTKHVKYGGSTAARTIACPGWHAQSADLPRAPASAYAEEGTALHTICEKVLMEDLDPQSFIGQTVDGVAIDLDHIAQVRIALDAWEALAKRYEVETFDCEVWADIPHVTDEVGGTLDVVARGPKAVIVADWKFGYNEVDPVENAQGLFYADAGFESHDLADMFDGAEELIIAIIQPRSAEPLKVWETTPDRIDSFDTVLMEAIQAAEGATPEDFDLLHTGSHCRYCPAEAVCPLKTGLVARSQQMEPRQLQDIGQALDMAAEMEDWIKAVRKRAHEQLEAGATVPGWKLVAKRPSRVWSDPDAVEAIVKRTRRIKRDESHPAEMLSVAKMEKLYKEKECKFEVLAKHVSSVSSGTTLAPMDDRRPAALTVKQVAEAAARIA